MELYVIKVYYPDYIDTLQQQRQKIQKLAKD